MLRRGVSHTKEFLNDIRISKINNVLLIILLRGPEYLLLGETAKTYCISLSFVFQIQTMIRTK